MLAFTVYKERITLHFEVRVLTNPYEVVNRFISNLRDSSALRTPDLHADLSSLDQFVLHGVLAALMVDGIEQLRLNEQIQCVIDRSGRYMFLFASLRQLFGSERLRQQAYLLQDDLAYGRLAHVMRLDIRIEFGQRRLV